MLNEILQDKQIFTETKITIFKSILTRLEYIIAVWARNMELKCSTAIKMFISRNEILEKISKKVKITDKNTYEV